MTAHSRIYTSAKRNCREKKQNRDEDDKVHDAGDGSTKAFLARSSSICGLHIEQESIKGFR